MAKLFPQVVFFVGIVKILAKYLSITMTNINTKSYWDKVFSKEIGKEEWRRYTVGFNKIRTYMGTRISEGDTILDVGCGYGILADLLRPLGCTITGWDISEVAIQQMIHKGYQGHCLDLESYLPGANEKFSHVIATEVLEHLEDPVRQLAKLHELAEKTVIITVPNNEFPDKRHREHLHSFDRHTIDSLFKIFPRNRLYLEEYLEEFFYSYASGKFKIIRTPNILSILEKPQRKSCLTSPKRANFKKNPVDICTCVFSSDNTDENDHFDIISRCLLSIVENTDGNCFNLHVGCNHPSSRVEAFVDWLVDCYGVRKYIGQAQIDAN